MLTLDVSSCSNDWAVESEVETEMGCTATGVASDEVESEEDKSGAGSVF